MRVYLLQRLAAMILTLLGVSLLIFGMIRLVPGTVVEQLLGQAAIASPEVLAAFRRFFGLDRPAHVQYLDWLAAVLRGDFGVSWLSGRPVLALLLERRVTLHHALRNALIPVVTVAGAQLGYIVGGIVVVEDVFTLPGVGRLLLDAIFQRDYPVVQGVILLLAAAFMALNLVVDLLYAVLDPRLRRG